MAETASILSPDKTVLIPDLDAGCSLSDSITADQLRAWKAQHPGAIVVMYVNTSAEVKAETDYCCTSSNAVKVVEHIFREHGDDTEVLFGPDMWLGAYVAHETGRDIRVWDGECHVHAGIRPADINSLRASEPDADFLIHPECGCTTQVMEYVAAGDVAAEGTHFLSTEGMMRHARDSERDTMIVATETGILHRMEQESPDKTFIPANRAAVCKYMKMITLPKLRDSLRDMKYRGERAGRRRRPRPPADRAHGRDRLERFELLQNLRLQVCCFLVEPPPRRPVEDLRAPVGKVVLHSLHAQLHRSVARCRLHRLPRDRRSAMRCEGDSLCQHAERAGRVVA